ncbi:MAG: Membrane-bound serine protease (ClpP class) [Candidatus Dadabacteria bacterium]|nr:Membrane-bound serine protease (ClpP class) [Candidatus Dadabacteria bacterium]
MRKKIFVLVSVFAFLFPSLNSRSDSDKKIILIEIDGTINPATLDYIRTGIEHAEKNSGEALVILLDTPGGLLASTKEIVKLILNSPVPVVIYVSPSGATATSAGVFITLSANIAAMAEGTSIGAAHPVMISPGGGGQGDTDKEDSERKKFSEKVENFASSFIESIAQKRKRNAKWAIEAVRNSASITETEALNKNVIDLISPDLTDLISKINGRQVDIPSGKKVLNTKGALVERLDMNVKQKLIDTLSTPDIAFLLISLGSLGLLIEFYNPGLIFPGVAGAICLLLGLVSLQILPFNYAGLALLILSIILFASEIYVTSYGLLSIGGITSFILGALLLFDTPESDVRVGFSVVISAASAIGLFFLYVGYYLLKAQRSSLSVGFEGLLGEEGVATTKIEKDGKIFIHGEYWDAESEETIGKGDKVKVIEVKGNFRLKVKKA